MPKKTLKNIGKFIIDKNSNNKNDNGKVSNNKISTTSSSSDSSSPSSSSSKRKQKEKVQQINKYSSTTFIAPQLLSSDVIFNNNNIKKIKVEKLKKINKSETSQPSSSAPLEVHNNSQIPPKLPKPLLSKRAPSVLPKRPELPSSTLTRPKSNTLSVLNNSFSEDFQGLSRMPVITEVASNNNNNSTNNNQQLLQLTHRPLPPSLYTMDNSSQPSIIDEDTCNTIVKGYKRKKNIFNEMKQVKINENFLLSLASLKEGKCGSGVVSDDDVPNVQFNSEKNYLISVRNLKPISNDSLLIGALCVTSLNSPIKFIDCSQATGGDDQVLLQYGLVQQPIQQCDFMFNICLVDPLDQFRLSQINKLTSKPNLLKVITKGSGRILLYDPTGRGLELSSNLLGDGSLSLQFDGDRIELAFATVPTREHHCRHSSEATEFQQIGWLEKNIFDHSIRSHKIEVIDGTAIMAVVRHCIFMGNEIDNNNMNKEYLSQYNKFNLVLILFYCKDCREQEQNQDKKTSISLNNCTILINDSKFWDLKTHSPFVYFPEYCQSHLSTNSQKILTTPIPSLIDFCHVTNFPKEYLIYINSNKNNLQPIGILLGDITSSYLPQSKNSNLIVPCHGNIYEPFEIRLINIDDHDPTITITKSMQQQHRRSILSSMTTTMMIQVIIGPNVHGKICGDLGEPSFILQPDSRLLICTERLLHIVSNDGGDGERLVIFEEQQQSRDYNNKDNVVGKTTATKTLSFWTETEVTLVFTNGGKVLAYFSGIIN